MSLVAREWAFDPAQVDAKAGAITFEVKNDGSVDHAFAVVGVSNARVEEIKAGETKAVTVTLKAGEYTLVCPLPGHEEAGMAAKLRVSE